MNLFYSSDYAGAGHAFDTTRKAEWIARSLDADPIDGVAVVAPTPLTADELARVHARAYVEAVRTGSPRSLAETQGFGWDPGLWRAVCASNGGVCDAVQAAIRDGVAGSLSSGLHHARRGEGRGFCTFNGLAVAALRASAEGRRVLIVDLDAHCGGGSHSLVAADPRITQVDVSTSGFDSYRPDDGSTLDLVSRAADYLPTAERRLEAAGRAGADLILYNAGMDVHEHGGGGICGLTNDVLAERERLVFAWAAALGTPVGFVLAGGYTSARLDEQGLVALHRLTIAAAAVSMAAACAGARQGHVAGPAHRPTHAADRRGTGEHRHGRAGAGRPGGGRGDRPVPGDARDLGRGVGPQVPVSSRVRRGSVPGGRRRGSGPVTVGRSTRSALTLPDGSSSDRLSSPDPHMLLP